MNNIWLIVDVSYLCHRNFHVHGQLEHDDMPTGVVYGMLRDINTLSERFGTNNFVFCFDTKPYLRDKIYPQYKKTKLRMSIHKDVEESKKSLRKQIVALRDDYLPSLGYKNIFWQQGYEADDIIASVALYHTEKAILISPDQDLYQLLGDSVSIYKPRERRWYTADSFKEEFYGLHPKQWVEVKSLAGCTSDNLPGIDLIGNITAAKFLTGMKVRSTVADKIAKWRDGEAYNRNLSLVQLPFAGCENFYPEAHAPVRENDWEKLTDRLGIKTLQRRES